MDYTVTRLWGLPGSRDRLRHPQVKTTHLRKLYGRKTTGQLGEEAIKGCEGAGRGRKKRRKMRRKEKEEDEEKKEEGRAGLLPTTAEADAFLCSDVDGVRFGTTKTAPTAIGRNRKRNRTSIRLVQTNLNIIWKTNA